MKARPVVYLLARAPSAYDSRLFRQAKFLAEKGYDVTVVATRYLDLPDREERDGYVIVRVAVDPLHYRLLRALRFVTGIIHRMRRRLWRLLARVCRRFAGRSRWVGRRVNRLVSRAVRRVNRRSRWVGRRVNHVLYSAVGILLRPLGFGWKELDPPIGPVSTKPLGNEDGRKVIDEGEHVWRSKVGSHSALVSGWGRTWTCTAFGLILAGPLMVGAFAFLTIPVHLSIFVVRQVVSLLLGLDDHIYGLIRSLALKWLFDRPLRLLDFTWRSYQLARSRGADVVQAKDLPALPSAYVVAKLTGARLLYDSSELNLESGPSATMGGPAKWLLRRYEGFFARRSDAVVTVNDSISTILARSYGISRPFVVRNCPSSVGELSGARYLRESLHLPEDRSIALYHGGFSANRGLHQLVESIAHLPDVTLVLMGYGPLEQSLRGRADELGLKDSVVIADAVPTDRLIDVVSSADVGVMPIQGTILSYYLALPNKLFECLMAGLPVAVSDLPEMARIVKEHQVGETFNPDDPKDIARAVRAILTSPGYREMKMRARKIALESYNWDVEARNFGDAYASALA